MHLMIGGLVRDEGGDIPQKTTGFEGAYRHEGGRDRGRVHGGAYRSSGKTAFALRGLPAAVPGGAQHTKGARVARPLDAESGVEAAVPAAACEVSPLRRAGGGFSVGGALGADDQDAVERGGGAGAGLELAGHRSPVRSELEKRGDDREADRGVWIEASPAAAGACDRDRRGEPPERPSLSYGGI